ncbi:MAG: 2-C-methyl-D-erythritol 4-phosphate cytidylyltransferase [Clostridia bacterium]|nr:2-C-methyl-D-erythritol 4-phosphate cytidylyltransferase [Clostridia bacterium]
MYKDSLFCSAVIVAAGTGKRMGADRPKQFLELCGKTIIERTAAVFGGCSAVDEIIIVSSETGLEECRRILSGCNGDKPVKYVLGGAERYDSVYNGIRAADERCGIVIIHDGVRPFVKEKLIIDSVEAAVSFGACAAGVKSKDTVKICDDRGFVRSTPDRSFVYAIQTPQTFRKEIITDAYEKAYEKGIFGTDDAAVAENAGYPVKIIEGSYDNIKITTPDDLLVGEKILTGGGHENC